MNFPYLSGYQDSNLGPPAPKAGALAGLRYTPKISLIRGIMSRLTGCKDNYLFYFSKRF